MATSLQAVPVIDESDGIVVWITFPNAGVDRPSTFGMHVKDRRLAERFMHAVADHAVFNSVPKITTDSNGKSYVHAPLNVMGRYLNAQLSGMGY